MELHRPLLLLYGMDDVLLYINLLILQFIHPVQAVPMINTTNPYYERHLEHMGQS